MGEEISEDNERGQGGGGSPGKAEPSKKPVKSLSGGGIPG